MGFLNLLMWVPAPTLTAVSGGTETASCPAMTLFNYMELFLVTQHTTWGGRCSHNKFITPLSPVWIKHFSAANPLPITNSFTRLYKDPQPSHSRTANNTPVTSLSPLQQQPLSLCLQKQPLIKQTWPQQQHLPALEQPGTGTMLWCSSDLHICWRSRCRHHCHITPELWSLLEVGSQISGLGF